ncbi:hypothetical protein MPSEU_000959800 [Mayamaea pseudoterrestris]|nr:hypothetical protein MPSEU_000959800 [Mayamaea pseudoterrestris]
MRITSRRNLCLLLCITITISATAREHVETTRQEILAGRKKRIEQLETILNDAKQRLDDHKTGKRLLEELETLKLEKKIEIFQRKLEQMQRVPDDLEIERLLNRERIRNERVDDRRKREDPSYYRAEMEDEL